MSLVTRKNDRRGNKQTNQPNNSNSRRRYTLEPPVPSTTNRNTINHQEQTLHNNDYIQKQHHISFPTNSSKTNDTNQYLGSNSTKSSYDNKYRIKSSINEDIDDPWVKALLERDIDFSRLNQHETPVQILDIPNIRYHSNNRNNSLKSISQDFYHNEENFKKTTTSPSQNRPIRKWILEQPTQSTTNSNHISINRTKLNSTQYNLLNVRQVKTDEEQFLLKQQRNSINYKPSQNKKHNKEDNHNDNDKNGITKIWYLFSGTEKRNIFIYVLGIMLYKFGLEAFNGSIVSLAANRYDRDASNTAGVGRTFEKVGLIIGLNQACQCIGSILISPLIKRWSTKAVLSVSVFLFALFTALLMIIDAATGGKIKPLNFVPTHENDYSYYGTYPTNVIIPIYCVTGISYGMVELIRRIIPQEIVGSDEEKLQRMDAVVHVFYEIAGVSGALITGLALIPRLGNNYAFIITPILFSLAAVVWFFINSYGSKEDISDDETPGGTQDPKTNYFKALVKGFYLFGESIYIGGKIILTNRKYFWLFPCYSLTLYVHRYIENGIAPQIAKRYLQNSGWSQIIVGGSNFGELLGALSVFFLTKKIRSPVVWLRLDCILLLIVWYIPFYKPTSITIKNAWIIALSFIPFGFGSAGDEVSLNAHIQSSLSKPQLENKDVSSLSSVIAFLYSSYIILYAILNPLLGKYIDSVYNANQTVRPAFIYTVGVQITIISVIVAASTFIPRGSLKLNPSLE